MRKKKPKKKQQKTYNMITEQTNFLFINLFIFHGEHLSSAGKGQHKNCNRQTEGQTEEKEFIYTDDKKMILKQAFKQLPTLNAALAS